MFCWKIVNFKFIKVSIILQNTFQVLGNTLYNLIIILNSYEPYGHIKT